MSGTIAKMIEKGNSQTIQKYVQNHLPSDQQSLERIYNQLLNYSVKPHKLETSSKKQLKSSRSQAAKVVQNKQPILLLSSGPVESYSKRTTQMIRKLKERGYKIVQNQQEKGMKVYESNKKKIISPLITNAKLLQGGEAEIDRMIQRFNANVDFYSNNIEDVQINLDNNIDREMREFMDRRETVLQQLRTKQKKSINNLGRYSGISSKIFGQEQKTPAQTLTQRSRASSHGQFNVWKAQQLMDSCQKELQLKKYRQINLKRNEFRSLQNKVNEEIEEFDIGSVINLKKVKQSLSKDQYNRYTHTYMKMMTNKMQEGSKCKLNGYAKQLLQDERKMRNIIDFSKK